MDDCKSQLVRGIYGDDHSLVAHLRLGVEDETDDEAIAEETAIVAANARLIAAAPDLYAALEIADNTLEDLRVPAQAGPNRFEQSIPGALAVIRAALAKAKGE